MGWRNSCCNKSLVKDTYINSNVVKNNIKNYQESRSYRIEEEKYYSIVNMELISSGQKSNKNNNPIPGKERLALQPTKFYVKEIGMSP